MSANRHSLVGDLLYGADPKLASTIGLERQWLHAVRLTFEHPTTGETVDVTDEYAPDLANSLKLIDEL
jgi:23S rRNA pseudouridine1911/1915/1917 synthase